MRRVRLTGLLAKPETVYQEDSEPSPATDGIQLEEHIYASIEVGYLEENARENATGRGMGRHGGAQPAGRYAKVTAIVALKGTNKAYAASARPEADVLLRMAGLQAAVSEEEGSESITYTPIDDGHESATVYAYSAGELFKIVGAQAKITSISCIAAQIARATFEIYGVLLDNVNDLALPAITYANRAVLPPVIKNSALTLGAFGPSFRNFNFAQNLELPARPRGNHPQGHAGYAIVDYDPQFTALIDNPAKAGWDARALQDAATEFPWSIQVGGQAYNRFTIAGPAGQVIKVPNTDSDGFAMFDLGVRCHHGAEDPAFSITFD